MVTRTFTIPETLMKSLEGISQARVNDYINSQMICEGFDLGRSYQINHDQAGRCYVVSQDVPDDEARDEDTEVPRRDLSGIFESEGDGDVSV